MNLPLILLSGPAGSGKDAIASFLVKNHNAVALGLADPMKRFAHGVFGFTEDQLWGPSATRNAVDERFKDPEFRRAILLRMYTGLFTQNFLKYDIVPGGSDKALFSMFKTLYRWAENLLETCGDGLTPRRMLQTFGTEWGRSMNRNVWVNATIRDAKLLLGGGYRYDRLRGAWPDPERSSVDPEWVIITDGRFRNEIIEVRSLGGEAWKIVSPETDASVVEKAGVAGHVSEAEQKTIPDHFFTAIIENDKSKGIAYAERLVKYIMKDPRRTSIRKYTPLTVNPNLTHGV